MNKLILCFAIIFTLTACSCVGQNNPVNCNRIANCNDCFNVVKIKALNNVDFECTPSGCGSILEFFNNPNSDSCYIDKEHNSLWLELTPAFEGYLSFEIIPQNKNYDYDFMIFQVTDSNYCKKIINKQIAPIRSNKSRNDTTLQSITGLNLLAKNNFVGSGPNEIYSKGITVKRNQKIILFIDNYYKGNEGFTLNFKYFEFITLKGVLKDKNTNLPIEAELSWEDIESGEVLATATSNKENGQFTIVVPIDKQKPQTEYNLSCNAADYFFTEQTFTGAETKQAKPIKPEFEKLKVNDKIKLNNLNFEPVSTQYSISALPTLRRIKRMMQANPTLKIEIEGHTNGCPDGVESAQKFSEERALSVKNYLVENGIDDNRISTKGYNCSNMLYPDENNPYHAKMNRRVEILITEY